MVVEAKVMLETMRKHLAIELEMLSRIEQS